jgi:hypothetical protein
LYHVESNACTHVYYCEEHLVRTLHSRELATLNQHSTAVYAFPSAAEELSVYLDKRCYSCQAKLVEFDFDCRCRVARLMRRALEQGVDFQTSSSSDSGLED